MRQAAAEEVALLQRQDAVRAAGPDAAQPGQVAHRTAHAVVGVGGHDRRQHDRRQQFADRALCGGRRAGVGLGGRVERDGGQGHRPEVGPDVAGGLHPEVQPAVPGDQLRHRLRVAGQREVEQPLVLHEGQPVDPAVAHQLRAVDVVHQLSYHLRQFEQREAGRAARSAVQCGAVLGVPVEQELPQAGGGELEAVELLEAHRTAADEQAVGEDHEQPVGRPPVVDRGRPEAGQQALPGQGVGARVGLREDVPSDQDVDALDPFDPVGQPGEPVVQLAVLLPGAQDGVGLVPVGGLPGLEHPGLLGHRVEHLGRDPQAADVLGLGAGRFAGRPEGQAGEWRAGERDGVRGRRFVRIRVGREELDVAPAEDVLHQQ